MTLSGESTRCGIVDLPSKGSEEAFEIEFVRQLGVETHRFKSRGPLKNKFPEIWVVEGGLVKGDERVFLSKGFDNSGMHGEDNCAVGVVVVVVMPPSDGEFTFDVSVAVDLFEFGSPVVLSD